MKMTAAATPPAFGKVVTVPGVYAPQADSFLLARALYDEGVCPGMDLLDLCTGSGALAVYASRMGARVTAVDLGRRAVLVTRLNASLAGQRVRVRRGDLAHAVPGQSFDVVISNPPNLMSLLGLHRELRGALVGHFASVEITSPPGSRRMAAAMRRTGAGPAAERFYDEHVEADAVHEQVVRRDVIGGLLDDEPHLAPDVVFGIEATTLLEDRLGRYLLARWRAERTALRCSLDRQVSGTERAASIS